MVVWEGPLKSGKKYFVGMSWSRQELSEIVYRVCGVALSPAISVNAKTSAKAQILAAMNREAASVAPVLAYA